MWIISIPYCVWLSAFGNLKIQNVSILNIKKTLKNLIVNFGYKYLAVLLFLNLMVHFSSIILALKQNKTVDVCLKQFLLRRHSNYEKNNKIVR